MTDELDSAKVRAAAWDIAQLDGRRAVADRPYLEFLRVADLSAGLYILEAGAMDRQVPHTEDEVYAVIAGSGPAGRNGPSGAAHAATSSGSYAVRRSRRYRCGPVRWTGGGSACSSSSVRHQAAPAARSSSRTSSTCQDGSWHSTVSGRSGGQARSRA